MSGWLFRCWAPDGADRGDGCRGGVWRRRCRGKIAWDGGWFCGVVYSSTCDTNSKVPATVQDRNMRQGRIVLTRELGRFQFRMSFSPGDLFCWAAAQPPSKSQCAGSRLPTGEIQDTSFRIENFVMAAVLIVCLFRFGHGAKSTS